MQKPHQDQNQNFCHSSELKGLNLNIEEAEKMNKWNRKKMQNPKQAEKSK